MDTMNSEPVHAGDGSDIPSLIVDDPILVFGGSYGNLEATQSLVAARRGSVFLQSASFAPAILSPTAPIPPRPWHSSAMLACTW